MQKRFTIGTALILTLLLTAGVVYGQEQGSGLLEQDVLPIEINEPSPEIQNGTVSCFDFYTFNSVQTQIVPHVSNTVSGVPIVFSGNIKNNNPYPVVDGSLYVKIFRHRNFEKDLYGPDVVDEFFVIKDVSIDAHAEVPVHFSWHVPSYAPSGDYAAVTFFTTARKFNLLGLSFTDDVIGQSIPFSVSGEIKNIVQFDKKSVTVDGSPYFFAAFPPQVDKISSIPIAATVTNTTDVAQKARVEWKTYYWDAQLQENKLEESFETISIRPRSTLPIQMKVKNADYPAYLVVGTLTWEDTKSIINVRFSRNGIDRPRINFPGISTFPLKKGESATLFTCFHNVGDKQLEKGGKIEITVSDEQWNQIAEYTYVGGITSDMLAVSKDFTPKENHNYVRLDARLYYNDVFIDEANVIYDCKVIDESKCIDSDRTHFAIPVITLSASTLGAIVAFLAVITLLVIFFFRKRNYSAL